MDILAILNLIAVLEVPALDLLGRHAPGLARTLGMGPMHFYYATGILSSVLDNAPTYLAFLSVDAGLKGGTPGNPADILRIATQAPANLIAISLGAVFFGAMTYIGNGPNFMVRSIVEGSGAKCPGFFGYILYYALPILLPCWRWPDGSFSVSLLRCSPD